MPISVIISFGKYFASKVRPLSIDYGTADWCTGLACLGVYIAVANFSNLTSTRLNVRFTWLVVVSSRKLLKWMRSSTYRFRELTVHLFYCMPRPAVF